MWDKYFSIASVEEVLDLLESEKSNAKIISGGTDLILEMKQGLHPQVTCLIDVSRINGLDRIWEENGMIHIGAGVTHNQCIASDLIRRHAFPLVQSCYGVGTPQIRNIATIAGNLATGSPANDTIVPLTALNASLKLRTKTGERFVKVADFYKGVRKTVLQPNELITEIIFNKLNGNQKGVFKRYILRATHSISVVNTAILITRDENIVKDVIIAIGCVAPTIVRAQEAESFLIGKELSNETIKATAEKALKAINPISDVRASAQYRSRLVRILVSDGLNDLLKNEVEKSIPDRPIYLWGRGTGIIPKIKSSTIHTKSEMINLKINQKDYQLNEFQDGLLVDLLRDGAGLTGTKIGCGEGECGACTITMDGLSVFSCLIPAPRAHGTAIRTIEGVADKEKLHPIQEAYIEEGAVQCGYCTPGFIMSTIQLLDEISNPTKEQIKEGLSGNLCRCTGYYRIIAAVEKAAQMMER